jgi:hypothetical protein
MRELLVQKDSSQPLEQNDWKGSKPLFGDGKIKICDTFRAITRFGACRFYRVSGRIGLVEQLVTDSHTNLKVPITMSRARSWSASF